MQSAVQTGTMLSNGHQYRAYNTTHPQVMPTPPVTMRKRKRPTTQVLVNYSEVVERDPDGKLREVIVIEDTPPPPTISPTTTARTNNGFSMSYQPPSYSAPIRTRARAAAEAQAISASSSSVITAPAPKRRKLAEEPRTAPAKKQATTANVAPTWPTVSSSHEVPVACDDKEGHYVIVPGDMIHGRYRTLRLLGQGTFGKVIEAEDSQTNNRVAIKIIRAIPKYRDASKIEVRVLQRLKERDPTNKHNCIHLHTWFDHRNHICLVSELYGICLYDFLKENEFAPFPRHHIQAFAKQLLDSVAFLHDLHLIHTDLKPENILLVKNDYKTVQIPVPAKRPSTAATTRPKRILADTQIRLIDFGSATFEEEYHSTVVSTRHYRAPEIILGLGWSYPCDAYSLGCILVEFYTGVALFQTHDNLEHLAMMEMVMGRIPDSFARKGARNKPEFFKEGNRLDWPKPKVSRQSKKDVKATRSLAEVIQPVDRYNEQFLNLVQRLLAFDPQHRISVKEALKHPYFDLDIPNEV